MELKLADILNQFTTLVIIKDYPDEWLGIKSDVNLDPSHGLPSVTNVAWINNPQYPFDVIDKNNVEMHIMLTKVKGIEITRNIIIGFMVFSINEKETKITTY